MDEDKILKKVLNMKVTRKRPGGRLDKDGVRKRGRKWESKRRKTKITGETLLYDPHEGSGNISGGGGGGGGGGEKKKKKKRNHRYKCVGIFQT
jgi:hypothetical protein